ncbi:arylsulfatase [Paucibacter oligotrophus]|uniref:Arylsulfatase n=1 Tax=Roseateles oligotrophus TaxID=1769250 RepID=A0A840LC31_9BURK|nr:arylsulfatase [Roseateles oligotrophus]MBB4844212.1 arylsulfatase [Roseateles oligotrophus]
MMVTKKNFLRDLAIMVMACLWLVASAAAQNKKPPNILVIWGDDVGMWNLSAYHRGMMGGSTPHIDRIAKEGMMFMDHYAQASCTAGRAAFITGQNPIRVGLASVGLPGAAQGLSTKDPTIASLLKPMGYATGQFGKNHLGDRDEHLPTNNGFDEFFGILYHLNAGEYVELYDYPKDPAMVEKLGLKQRGVIHSWAQNDGKQKIVDTGPFGKERQRNLEWEVLKESKRFITDAAKADKPFFVWHNLTRTHMHTHLSKKYDGATGYGLYADGVKEMDDVVGELLKLIDDLGVADNTMILFSTDNGAYVRTWPDGGNHPFHGEKGVGGWEGGFRVPAMVKWPGVVPAGSTSGEMMAMEDWLPTIMAQLGQPDVKKQLLSSYKAGKRSYDKIHLDGYDQTQAITGKGKSQRKEFFYMTESVMHGVRIGDYKFLFKKQDKWFQGTQQNLVIPYIINLKLDPFERFLESDGYMTWMEDRSFILPLAAGAIAEYAKSLKDYPPRMQSAEFNIDEMLRASQPKGQ